MGNSKAKRRYVALTTHGARWWVVLVGETGENRQQLAERAERDICGDNWDRQKTIEQDTELKNLQVLSYSAAMRAYPAAMRHWEYARWNEIPY